MAVYDDVRICNMALDRVGCAQPISALTELSAAAKACTRWFEVCRDRVLEDHAWPFATKELALAVVDENPNDDWAFSYRYPADCVRFLGFVIGSKDPKLQPPWDIGGDASAKLIFTDQGEAVGRYTRRETTAALYPAAFASLVAWKMAVEIATPLSRKDGARMEAMQMYYAELDQAKASQTAERRPPDAPDGGSVRARA